MPEQTPSFSDFKLNKQLLQAVEAAGFTAPTPIQQKAIPRIMAGHDLMGIAQTGTGKTAAYLLPILMKVKYAQGDHPRALILVPTRELSLQVAKQLEALAQFTDIRYTAIYGGVGPKSQIEAIQQGIDILIATPGRAMDIYRRGELIFKEIKHLVLDEADRMMDMGFMPQIRRLLEVLPGKRQHLLFSATMHETVVRLSEEFLDFPERVEVTPQATTAETVEQMVYKVPNFKTKIHLLEHLLRDEETFYRVIVFTRTKKNADNIGKFLGRKVAGETRIIHANKGQNSRINAMNAFKEGELRMLVSTDVTARGIDVSMVSHVINFDIPILYEDYVHRIGRTGRAEQEGVAISFCTPAEEYHLGKIEKLIRKAIPEKQLPSELTVTETPKEEASLMAREIDNQRRREDPTFKGAFHEKKQKPKTAPSNKAFKRNKKKKKR